jgi:hypothetical protein
MLHPQANYEGLTQATTDTGLCNEKEFSAMCVSPETNKNVIQVLRMQHEFVCHLMF